MRVVAALDSFKGSVGSTAAGEAVRTGVLSVDPTALVTVVPVADGGEGTLEAVAASGPASWVDVDTVDALGRPLVAPYLRLAGGTAVVEAARTIGLAQLGEVGAHVPPRASSLGVGVHLAHALSGGTTSVLLGLGGSACTDGGLGLLTALGVEVRGTTREENPLWGFDGLDGPLPDLSQVVVLSDVTNPLLGRNGAAHVFGPQKGADAAQVEHLDARLRRLAAAFEEAGSPVADLPGAGAAGGIGAAMLACGATVVSGFARLAALTGLDTAVAGADLVFTGEGSLDRQTGMGKAPLGVATWARRAGAVVVGLGGRVDRPGPDLFDAVFPVHGRPRALPEALDPEVTASEIAATAAEVYRLVVRR